jgi:hypothetical protein
MGILFLLLVATGAIWEGRRLLNDPNVILLMPEDGAQWLAVPRPMGLFVWLEPAVSSGFRKPFDVPPGFKGAEIKVRALREVKVFVDRHPVFQTEPGGNWKEEHRIELPATLAAGPHVLDLAVRNLRGPALALVNAPELNLDSNQSWQASGDGNTWFAAVTTDAPKEPLLELLLGPCSLDVAALWPLLVMLFAAGLGGSLIFSRKEGGRDWVPFLRWLLLAAWIFFGINSYFKFPSDAGYDVEAHVKYIHFILEHGRAPLPDEGTEFFQAPFFYLVSAGFYRLNAARGAINVRDRHCRDLLPVGTASVWGAKGFAGGGDADRRTDAHESIHGAGGFQRTDGGALGQLDRIVFVLFSAESRENHLAEMANHIWRIAWPGVANEGDGSLVDRPDNFRAGGLFPT